MIALRPVPWKRLLVYDQAVLVRVRRWEWPWATLLMRSVTRVGDPSGWVAMGGVLLASGGRASRHGLVLAASSAAATVLSQTAKRLWRRSRPTKVIRGFTALAENPDVFSFPSGHTAAAVAVATTLSGEGAALGPAAWGLAGAMAISRVYLGAHYPLDVLAGALLGVAAGALVRAVLRPPVPSVATETETPETPGDEVVLQAEDQRQIP